MSLTFNNERSIFSLSVGSFYGVLRLSHHLSGTEVHKSRYLQGPIFYVSLWVLVYMYEIRVFRSDQVKPRSTTLCQRSLFIPLRSYTFDGVPIFVTILFTNDIGSSVSRKLTIRYEPSITTLLCLVMRTDQFFGQTKVLKEFSSVTVNTQKYEAVVTQVHKSFVIEDKDLFNFYRTFFSGVKVKGDLKKCPMIYGKEGIEPTPTGSGTKFK